MAGKKFKKEDIKTVFKLEITGGQASPAPPLGPILGQNGVNIGAFTQEFNDKTREMMGERIPVIVTVLKKGNETHMEIMQPTVASMIKRAANIQKGSANPKKEKVGSITNQQVAEIAERKMPDLNTSDPAAAAKIVIGTAKSLGVDVK